MQTDVIAPSAPQAVASPATARLTPSMLFYAFADRVAHAPGLTDAKKAVPCAGTDVKVKQDELAVALVHAAFWDLRRRGRIRLEEVEKKVLFVKTRSLKVRVAPDADAASEVPDSLEFALLRRAIAHKGDGDVRGVVRALYSNDAPDPYRRAIAMANVAEIAAGLVQLEVEERHGLAKVRGKKETLVWQCDVVAAHRAEFNAVVTEWNRDHDADTAGFDRLAGEIDKAIESRRVEDSDSIFDD